METVKIIECPRDAWQGLPCLIPTEVKIAYLGRLIEAGFRSLDAVSFVAPKYVPQMADSEQVMAGLREAGLVPVKPNGKSFEVQKSKVKISTAPASLVSNADKMPGFATFEFRVSTAGHPETSAPRPAPEIIGIVVNETGLERALHTDGVTTLGYPYSVSANFRRANANMSKSESQALVEKLQRAVAAPHAPVRRLVVYISMAFGNNYDEPWGPEIVVDAVQWLRRIGVREVSLADTIGTATPEEVGELYRAVKESLGDQAMAAIAAPGTAVGPTAAPSGEIETFELGVHLHSRADSAAEKVLAAYEAGCRRFDSALTGLGGCPFAGDDLVGNIPTEIVISALSTKGAETGIEPWALLSAVEAANEIREKYAHE